MLSPKMQRTVRVNDSQLVMLSERAHFDHSVAGYLHKKTADSTKWQLRWFILYQPFLESEDSLTFVYGTASPKSQSISKVWVN
ncbi:Ras protein-specific guanine nucleotide-releasing factor [Homalodisca vitripennis]|nr:Ras protein-specific guanine nucleotide-releasing factor [Homalodisca vitripennis]